VWGGGGVNKNGVRSSKGTKMQDRKKKNPGFGAWAQGSGVVRVRSRSCTDKYGLKNSHDHKPKRDTTVDMEWKMCMGRRCQSAASSISQSGS
jgi:hypothetical protein